jgi:predicted RNase H-like HicB family nuclease
MQTGYSAYSPDVFFGCVSTGATLEEVNQNILEAIEFHIDSLIEEGLEIPKPSTYSAYVEVAE